MKDRWDNRRDRWRERQLGRGGKIVEVVVMVSAGVVGGGGGGGGGRVACISEGCCARL